LAELGAGRAIAVASAGVGALVGEPIQPYAARLVAAAGGDVSAFEAQDLTSDLVDGADLVLAMTRMHRGAVAQHAPKALPRLFTLREFARLGRAAVDDGWHGPKRPAPRLRSLVEAARAQRGLVMATELDDDVPDPYMRDESVYEAAFALIDAAVTDVARLVVPGDDG
jgi:protein-tyrosine phosphatase